MDEDPIVELYTGTLWEAEMIASLLREEGIESFLKNDVLTSYAYEPASTAGVKVMVLCSDLERARAVVDEFWKT